VCTGFSEADGDALRPAPALGAAFRAPWSPMHEGAEAGGGGGGSEAPAVKRGRGRPPRTASSAADAVEARKRRASLALAAAAERRSRWGLAQGGGGGEEDDDMSGAWGDDQECECFVCQEPGMLIVCDAPSCRKAYHKPCLGLTAWGDSFYCPRHRCAVCRTSEADLAKQQKREREREREGSAAATSAPSSETEGEAEAEGQEEAGKGRGGKGQGQRGAGAGGTGLLWKCAECPVAYCPEHLPPGINYGGGANGSSSGSRPASASTEEDGRSSTQQTQQQRQQRLCGHCRTPSPRVQLAAILERSWARLATNYLALPFMRPFLHGVSGGGNDDGNGNALLDLVGIALRIRGLCYATAEEYLADLRSLQEQGRRLAGAGEEGAPVREAMETLRGNGACGVVDWLIGWWVGWLVDCLRRASCVRCPWPSVSHDNFGTPKQ
jgi:hypothetical protein